MRGQLASGLIHSDRCGDWLAEGYLSCQAAWLAVRCLDPFHLLKLGTEAREEVRKDLWREMRKLSSPMNAGKFLRGKMSVVESRNPDQTSGTSSLGCQEPGWRACRDEGVPTGDLCWRPRNRRGE